MNFLLFAADFTPVSADWQSNLYNVLVIVALILAIIAVFKRKPPLDVELAKFTLAIKQLSVVAGELKTWSEERMPSAASSAPSTAR